MIMHVIHGQLCGCWPPRKTATGSNYSLMPSSLAYTKATGRTASTVAGLCINAASALQLFRAWQVQPWIDPGMALEKIIIVPPSCPACQTDTAAAAAQRRLGRAVCQRPAGHLGRGQA